MKIAICYPPLEGPGRPLLSQNRQFQWYRSPFTSYTVYPVIPAYAATLLKTKEYDVLWEDCVAEKKTYPEFISVLEKENPNLIAIESKTPVIKQHWQIINDLKERFPQMKIVLMGDHVTALPEESLKMCKVDYIIVGGDYDFLLADLADYISGRNKKFDTGIYYKDKHGNTVSTGGDKLGHNLNQLPIIDRKLTKWWLYARGNGNFKYEPNTYTMIGRDCWWRRPSKDGKAGCTFCSWTSIFPTWRRAEPERLLEEIGHLIELGVKEVFDDTGTFPVGKWLEDFCQGMIKRGYHEQIVMGCNMRAGATTEAQYNLMGEANFRFILYGLESVNQQTLDRLNKGTTPAQLKQSLQWAKRAGLEPHITVMFGYPWETKQDTQKTVDFVHKLFDKGYIDTMQATLLMPYPGTALYDEAQEKGWLLTDDYTRYDMSEPILKTPMTEKELKAMVRASYHAFWSPRFIWRRLKSIRSVEDLRFLSFLGTKYVSKLLDFLPKTHNDGKTAVATTKLPAAA